MSVFNLFEDFESFGIREGHIQSALQDAWLDYSRSGDISMREFFASRKITHPHRYASFAPVEDSPENLAFYSIGAQAAYVREHGEQAARELLASQGLTLGHVKAKPKGDDKIPDSTNPYSDACKLSPAEKEKRIASLLKSGGTKLCAALARAQNKTITGQPLQPVGAARVERK